MTKLQNHRSLGAALAIEKDRIRWHHQVNPRAVYIGKRLNSAFQFALERALIGDLLIEFGLAPGHLVKQLKTKASTMRLALRCRFAAEQHPTCLEEHSRFFPSALI